MSVNILAILYNGAHCECPIACSSGVSGSKKVELANQCGESPGKSNGCFGDEALILNNSTAGWKSFIAEQFSTTSETA